MIDSHLINKLVQLKQRSIVADIFMNTLGTVSVEYSSDIGTLHLSHMRLISFLPTKIIKGFYIHDISDKLNHYDLITRSLHRLSLHLSLVYTYHRYGTGSYIYIPQTSSNFPGAFLTQIYT